MNIKLSGQRICTHVSAPAGWRTGMCAMKLHFEPNLDYQLQAIEAVATCSVARRCAALSSR